MKTDLRYTEQDYLDALEGAGPLGWQKDLKALVRELAALIPQAAMAPALRDERDELERDVEHFCDEIDLLNRDIEDLQDRIKDLETMLDDKLGLE